MGMHVRQQDGFIVTDQDFYVDNLEIPYLQVNDGASLDTILNDDEQGEFRAAVGRIGYVANSSRPDHII